MYFYKNDIVRHKKYLTVLDGWKPVETPSITFDETLYVANKVGTEFVDGVAYYTIKINELPLEVARENVLNEVSKRTQHKIVAIADDIEQRNNLALYNELLEKKIDGTITEDETVLMTELKDVWETIKAFRNDYATAKATINSCSSVEELKEFL